MKRYKRRKDLDKYDKEFGLLIAFANEDLQTGQIEYGWDNEIGANYEQIDRRKGRILSTWIDDLPVYIPRDNEEEAEASYQRVHQYYILEAQMKQILEQIKEKNKELGFDEQHLGYLE